MYNLTFTLGDPSCDGHGCTKEFHIQTNHSKEDIYSVPEKGQLLFDACQSQKKLVWFDKGGHSKVRINNQEKYDSTVVEFLENTFNT